MTSQRCDTAKELIKLAYVLGYKCAEAEERPALFDSNGRFLPGFEENMSIQDAADNPWVIGGIGAGSTVMAARSLRNPGSKKRIAKLESDMHKHWANQQKPGFMHDIRESIRPGSTTLPSKDPTMVNYRYKLRNLRMKRYPGFFKRLGKAGLWGSLAAATAAALLYRNDMI